MQAFGTVGTATGDKATTTGQVLTALIAAFADSAHGQGRSRGQGIERLGGGSTAITPSVAWRILTFLPALPNYL